MKALLSFSAIALLLASCRPPVDDSRDAEITQLRGEADSLRRQLAEAQDKDLKAAADLDKINKEFAATREAIVKRYTALLEEQATLKAKNAKALAQLAFLTDKRKSSDQAVQANTRSPLQKQIDAVEGRGASLHYSASNTPPEDSLPSFHPAPSDPFKDIPKDQMAKIRQFASGEFPRDGKMQVFVVEKQAEGWRTMSNYRAHSYTGIPDSDKTGLIAFPQHEFPDDFATQVFVFEKQAAAWIKVRGWERNGGPSQGDINAAKATWKDDWAMVAYDAEKKAPK